VPADSNPSASSKEAFASCAADEVAVGGGARIVQSLPWDTYLISSHPWPAGPADQATAWRAFAANKSAPAGRPSDATLVVFVLCATR